MARSVSRLNGNAGASRVAPSHVDIQVDARQLHLDSISDKDAGELRAKLQEELGF